MAKRGREVVNVLSSELIAAREPELIWRSLVTVSLHSLYGALSTRQETTKLEQR